MADARTADFLGGSGKPIAMPKLYPPGEEPNPKNPGGISNNELARRKEAARLKEANEYYAKLRAQQSKEQGKKIVAEREAFAKTQPTFLERAASDVKAVVKAAAKPVLTVAKNPVVQAINPAAAIAAHTTSKAAGGSAVIKGVVGKVVDQGTAAATKTAGVKPPTVPSAAKAAGKEAVASLSLPKVKIDVPDPKKELAAAKQAASSAKAAVTSATTAPAKTAAAAVKTVAAAAPKVTPPKVPAPKVSAPVSTATKAAASVGKTLEAQLDPLSKQKLATVPGAKIVVGKDGKVSVSTPASSTTAASLFKPVVATAATVAAVKPITTAAASALGSLAAVKPPSVSASATVAIKPPAAASKPPAMTTTKPPPASPSVASTITTAAPPSAPPVIKPPPLATSDVPSSSGPTLEGYLVKLDGTIETRRRYRAA